MGRLMHDALGIGLAATQVGRLSRFLVYRVEHDGPVQALVNPVLEWSSRDEDVVEEGCLSLPGVHVDVERPIHVRVRAQDAGKGPGSRSRRRAWRRASSSTRWTTSTAGLIDRRPRAARPAPGGHADPARAVRGRLRTAFLGTSDFAAAILRRLAASPHRPALVVTRPDRPAGRGRRLTAPPVAVTARELGLEVDQPDSVNSEEARDRIAAAEPDALVLCAFGALVRDPLLSDYEILNVHPSLLPRWRGAAPIERAIMAGDAETGVSIMRLGPGLDDGPVALRAAVPITAQDDYATLSARLEDVGADLLLRALDDRPPWREQDEAGATYAEKLTAADRTLDPSAPAGEQERVVRALHPAHPRTPGAARRLLPGRAPRARGGGRRAGAARGPAARGPARVLRRLPPRPPSVTDREVAEGAAAAAGAAALARFGGALDVAYKSSGGGPVTDADRAAEAAALAVLRAERPGDGVLGEEGGATGGAGGRRWVVDALDGTANLHITASRTGARPSRCRGRTARCWRRRCRTRCARSASAPPAARPPVAPGIARRPAPAPPLDRALVATFLRPDKVGPDRAGPLSAALWTATGGLRSTGSGSLELAWVSAGRLDAWVQPDPDPWDWLPGSLLVEAAGGATAVVGAGPAWHVAGPTALVDELATVLARL